MMASRTFLHCLLSIVLLMASLRVDLCACAPAPRNGQFVTINEEAAVIIWDAPTRTQHFIRTASFSGAEDFGFLVPTPTKPELAEARDALRTVSQIIKPKVVTEARFDGFDFTPLTFALLRSSGGFDTAMTAVGRSAVRVLEERQVAGYDAVILEADNAKALNDWLGKHGYESRPTLVGWLEPYVKARWKITAFKIATDSNRFSTSPVRMSFTTDRPFFPYREPADLRGEEVSPGVSRSLKVFFLSDARMQGALETRSWPGEVVWANRLDEAFRQPIAEDCGLNMQKLPTNLWLTAFEDLASPRPGTDDVFFTTASVQNITMPPPVVIENPWRIPLPLDLLLLGILLVLGWFLWKRKSRSLATPH
jgi:hypothetical protein